MAPVDRREHRQQRIRGAGATAVQTNFGFSFGALAPLTKQTSLPPPSSSRQTPTRTTPQASNGSALRHRSVSIQRSGTVARRSPLINEVFTPLLGKRKRNSTERQSPVPVDLDVDELSPDRDANVPSIEKVRRVPKAVSPVREDDTEPDELSYLENGGSAVNHVFTKHVTATPETPLPSINSTIISQGLVPDFSRNSARTSMNRISRTPQAIGLSGAQVKSTTARASRPTTPSASNVLQVQEAAATNITETPNASRNAEDSEDELTPAQAKSTIVRRKTASPRRSSLVVQSSEVDELSPVPATVRPNAQGFSKMSRTASTTKPVKRPRSTAVEEDEDILQSTPASSIPQRVGSYNVGEEASLEEDLVDELSPEPNRLARERVDLATLVKRKRIIASTPDIQQDMSESEEATEVTPAPAPKPKSRQNDTTKGRPKTPGDSEPPKKRQKRGPTQKFTVMRLKGYSVKGLTVVDIARTRVNEIIKNRVNKMTMKLDGVRDSAIQREVKSQINHTLAFDERLEDYFLELQDANNSAIDNGNKLKQLKKERSRLQNEFMEIQQERQEVALEHDEITAEFQRKKKDVEAKNNLSAWMYDIQAAIRSGKEKAKNEGRENEGPAIPTKMLLESVALDVDPRRGLLASIRGFNGVLERSVGFLEGRA